MMKLVPIAALCALGVIACSHLREPDDAQLATLLQGDHANAADANAPLDSRAIECLRAWSGDADLLKGMAMRYAGEDGRKSCRTTLDGRVADAGRNPDRFTFAEISAPKVVRRAIELQQARRLAAAGRHAQRGKFRPRCATLAPPGQDSRRRTRTSTSAPPVRVCRKRKTLCLQTQQAAADPAADSGLKRFAGYCMGSLRKLRTTMEASARNGRTPEQLRSLADSADNIANVARELLAAPQVAPRRMPSCSTSTAPCTSPTTNSSSASCARRVRAARTSTRSPARSSCASTWRRSRALPEAVRARLLARRDRRLTDDGVLVIQANRFRDQAKNREDARAAPRRADPRGAGGAEAAHRHAADARVEGTPHRCQEEAARRSSARAAAAIGAPNEATACGDALPLPPPMPQFNAEQRAPAGARGCCVAVAGGCTARFPDVAQAGA